MKLSAADAHAALLDKISEYVCECVCERVFARLSSTFFRFSVFLIFIFISILIWFGFIMLFFRSVLFLDLSHMPCVTVALLPS